MTWHLNTTTRCAKTRPRVRTSFRPRRDTRKRGHEYQFPGRVPLKKPSGVDFLQTSHEISKFPCCTCTQRSMTREIRWRSRSSNAIINKTRDIYVYYDVSLSNSVLQLLCKVNYFFTFLACLHLLTSSDHELPWQLRFKAPSPFKGFRFFFIFAQSVC